MVLGKKNSGCCWKLIGIFFLISHTIVLGVSIRTDKANAIYNLKSEVKFTVSCSAPGATEYTLSNDGGDILNQGSVRCSDNIACISGTLGKPGFLRCSVIFTASDGGKSEKAVAAAAFDLEGIRPARNHMPADFEKFWQKKKRELAAVPMSVIMTPEPSEEGIVICDVNIPCFGVPVRGYYARPANPSKAGYPAIAFFQGAGVSSAGKDRITEYCKEGFIAIEINAHGITNGQSSDYYKDLYATVLKGYHQRGKEKPDTCYFTSMFLRVYRTLEFLKAQTEWNGRHLIAYGSSQGGAQAIAGAGLDSDVSFLFASVPGMCDHGGVINGWPRLVPVEDDGLRNQRILDSVKYVDCVNFASKANCPAFFTVGFIDNVCRPTSIYAMYNSYAGPKEIAIDPLMKHAIPEKYVKMAKEKILMHVTE